MQVNNEFQQVKIKDLNDENNVEMFMSTVRDGKAFAAEQKIRELKSRIAKLTGLKTKITPTKMILTTADNMNSIINEKYVLSLNEMKKNLCHVKNSRHFLIFIELNAPKNYTIG